MIQLNDIKSKLKANSLFLPFYVLAFLMLASCAKMGQPDGGWFDETPPKVIGASPADKGVNVKQKKVNIYFDEYIKVDNPTEKVVVSPPQLEVPEIKASGKHIQISLVDSLKPNTTEPLRRLRCGDHVGVLQELHQPADAGGRRSSPWHP